MKSIKFIGIKEASKITGLSEQTLRKRVLDGRIPHIRSNKEQSKVLFDKDLLLPYLRSEALGNIDPEPRSYLANLFQKPDEEENITPPSATFKP